ncbi:hematopoietic prostaglandin D synthase-like [Eriocheir sinensis]|uniref:hematopoietic prostaglandin D synthase-like n=1 Tax=Eriocheir sinensis TaxID=95602 RepID=UPI0021C91E45|nr:hematopoietic prostaglandin D synthase-like [Eriocheir sinensis]
MAEYKLTYFIGRGLGEVSRWIMHFGNIPFTDERVEEVDWPERKKHTPAGKLPVLEVEGKMLNQSLAIGRFLASKVGLVPQDPLHAAFCDAVAETMKELAVDIFDVKNAEGKSKEENMRTYKEDFVPSKLMPMMERLNKRFEGNEWFISGKLTWGDMAIALTMEPLFAELPELAAKFPKLKAHSDKMVNLPGIKEYLKKRPETSY